MRAHIEKYKDQFKTDDDRIQENKELTERYEQLKATANRNQQTLKD